jgi:multicomponent K+:H+ antiporter subunit G
MNPAVHELPLWLDILITALLVVGAAFTLVGSWGLARLSDFLKRLHGPTKATTLGVGCVLIASSLYFSAGAAPSLREFLIMMFLFMTAPVSAHMLVKALLKQQPALRPPLPTATGEASDAERNSV